MDDAELYSSRLKAVRERVNQAATAVGRSPAEVQILLATKTQPAALIRDVLELPEAAGMWRGENRVQELVAKGPELSGLTLPTHLIGPLQSNKINAVLRWVDGIESIDSVELAQRISTRLESGRTLDVMVQVNVSGESSKHGVAPADALALAREVSGVAGLRLTGFMTIGANTTDLDVVRAGYAQLATIRDRALAEGLGERLELSMGMSGDLEAAVAEGATLVRVGTAVFGPRPSVR